MFVLVNSPWERVITVTTGPRSLFSYRDSTFLSIFAVPNNTVSLFLLLLLLLFSLNFSSGNEVIIQLQSTKEVINGNFIRCTIRFSLHAHPGSNRGSRLHY